MISVTSKGQTGSKRVKPGRKTRRWRAGRTVQSSEVPMRRMLLKKEKQVIARAVPTDGDMMELIVMHVHPGEDLFGVPPPAASRP
jgi:hypothetical protein